MTTAKKLDLPVLEGQILCSDETFVVRWPEGYLCGGIFVSGARWFAELYGVGALCTGRISRGADPAADRWKAMRRARAGAFEHEGGVYRHVAGPMKGLEDWLLEGACQ